MNRHTARMLRAGASRSAPPQQGPALSGPMASDSDLASLFECPVCYDFVLPPILQCENGHLVCSNCRPRLTQCPTCRGPLGSIRNLAMEKVARLVFPPCRYASLGCEVRLPCGKKAEHELQCEFRPVACPCPGLHCMWRGSLNDVLPHIMDQHKSIMVQDDEDLSLVAMGIDFPQSKNWVVMQSCFGCHFMTRMERQQCEDGQRFVAIVQLIGTRKQAERFTYSIELNGRQRRLSWEAKTRSIHEGVADTIESCDCMVFSMSTAQLFTEDSKLSINFSISEHREEMF